jgi:hypothetical protein
MHEATIRLQNEALGRLRVDPLQIRGDGGPLMPALVVPVDLDLYLRHEQTLVLERLTAVLWTQPGSGPRVRLGSPSVTETIGSEHGPLQSFPQGANPHRLELRFELPGGSLRLLDEHIQGSQGSVAQFSLTFETRIAWARQILNDEPTPGFGTLLDLLPFWRTSTEEMQIQLPRERWARDVAPVLGHDRVRLVAVELPSSAGPLGDQLATIFDAASRAYDAADWRETVQKCRDVRNHVEQCVRDKSDERLFRVVARNVGADEKDARIKFLDDVWKALADLTSDAHHVGSVGRLDAATAHATLLLTATMIQYVGELLGPV